MTRPYMTHPPRLLQLAVPCRTGLSRHLPPFCSAQLRRLRLFVFAVFFVGFNTAAVCKTWSWGFLFWSLVCLTIMLVYFFKGNLNFPPFPHDF